MNESTQSVFFNAVPLLVAAAAYLAVGAALLWSVWRVRARVTAADWVPPLLFAPIGVTAAVLGAVVLYDREPIGGRIWTPFAAILIGLVPPLVALTRLGDIGNVVASAARVREAEARSSELDRELGAVSRLSNALARTHDAEDVARVLCDEIMSLFAVEFAAISLVSDDATEATGFLARRDGRDWPWWSENARFDLLQEPSGVASAAFEASALAVYDLEASPNVRHGLAAAVGAKSAAFVPLCARDRVIAVLSVATTRTRRAFTGEELALMQALSAEAALALERTRSATALAEALERERLVTSIARKLRTELDTESVLRVAVEETARALGVDRAFVRLGEEGEMRLAAEWAAPGLEPLGGAAERLPAANLALRERRTVAVADVDRAPELGEPALGGTEAFRALGTQAVLATPIAAFDEVVGVFALHQRRSGAWTQGEVALAEAVASEAAVALRAANLLDENRRRLGRQRALVESAEALTAALDFDTVITRLAEEVVTLLRADAGDCWLFERGHTTLRCRAVRGLPREVIGSDAPPEAMLGDAIRSGGPILKRDVGASGAQLLPSPAYADFAEVMQAPIGIAGEGRGVLGVWSRARGRFAESDLEVLEAFAKLASLALGNAEAYAQSARQARVQRGFYRIAAMLGQSLSLRATLDAVAQAAAEALGGDFAAVLMPRAGRLALSGSHELPRALAAQLDAGVAADEEAFTRAAEQRRLLAAPDAAQDERLGAGWRELVAGAGVASLLAVPVEPPRSEVAGLVVAFFLERRDFSDDDVELAYHLGDATRGALERSELFEAERTSRALAQQLARTGSLLATELDPANVVEEVAQQALQLLGADACAIRELADDELIVTAAEGAGAVDAIGTRSPAGAWLSGDVVQSRAPVAIDDVDADPRLRELDPMLAAHSAYVGVPLVGPEGALKGVLAAYSLHPRSWKQEEIEALLALAANTSAALSNAELYQRVETEKERSLAVLQNVADGIVAVDRDGKVVQWNAAAEKITGVPAEEAIGLTPAQVLGRNLESGGDAPVSIVRGGEEVSLSLTEAVMRDPAGQIAGRIFAFRDISADKLLDEMKSEFVAKVSHSLRTPLTSIYGFAETLLRQDVLFGDQERETFLRYIASESERLTAIVDRLLDVARLETGDLKVSLAPTDVRDVVAEAVGTAQQNGGNGHRFVVDLPSEPLTAEADREKLRQIFSILLENAVKYSPQGGTVTVGAQRRNDVVEIRVVDEGIGIPESAQERIFRKFAGMDEQDDRGTGLGLFLARGLVAAMGGRIWVAESREGEGSAFAFELPIARPRSANE